MWHPDPCRVRAALGGAERAEAALASGACRCILTPVAHPRHRGRETPPGSPRTAARSPALRCVGLLQSPGDPLVFSPVSHLGKASRVTPELRGPLGWLAVFFEVWLLHGSWSLSCCLGYSLSCCLPASSHVFSGCLCTPWAVGPSVRLGREVTIPLGCSSLGISRTVPFWGSAAPDVHGDALTPRPFQLLP